MISFLRGQKRVVGVDVGTACVKVVAFERSGNHTVKAIAAGMAEVEGDRRLEALQEAIRQAGGAGGRVVTAVSGRSVTVRYVTMPMMSDAELRSALPLEADKYMPYDVSELYLDGQRLALGGNAQEMRVLMVSVKKALLQEHVGLLKQVKCPPAVVDVDAFALGNAYELTKRAGAGEGEPNVVALVDVGASKTSINILHKDVSCFTREVYVGGRDLTEAIAKRLSVEPAEAEQIKRNPEDHKAEILDAVASVAEDLGNEIRLSFDYFESQFEEEVQQVKVSGGGARLGGLDQILQGVFGKPTGFWDPMGGVVLPEGAAGDLLRNNAAQFAIAVGLAARIQAVS